MLPSGPQEGRQSTEEDHGRRDSFAGRETKHLGSSELHALSEKNGECHILEKHADTLEDTDPPCRVARGGESTENEAQDVKVSSVTSLPIPPKSTVTALDPTLTPTPQDDSGYPEGGLRAWLVVFGSFCGMFASFGIANTLGSFEAYISTNQLSSHSPSQIGWIFSLYTFLAFAGGLYIGPLFDIYGPRLLVFFGSVSLVLTMLLLGVCEKYWHFMLVFSVLGGIGTSLLFTPCIAAIGHFFLVRRGNATGIGATGGAVGGIVFPLLLQSLIPRIGFPWSTRIVGFIILFLCAIANILVRSRLPRSQTGNRSPHPDFRIFAKPAFTLTVLGVFLIEWALFIPLTYITSYALASSFPTAFSYQILPILNVGSVFGRWLPGFYSDIFGRYNTSLFFILLTIICCFAIWLPFGSHTASLVVFALLFGFASGSNISLTPVCVGQLCDTRDYGRYYATCYTVVSLSCLTGIPIAGTILESNGGSYWGLIVFTGACYVGSFFAFAGARFVVTGWKIWDVY